MDLRKQIDQDLKDGLRAKDEIKLSTLRLLCASLKNEEILLKGRELSDEKVAEIINREAKKRKEAALLYQKGDRIELAEKEKTELEILERYLPKQLSDDKIKEAAIEVIERIGASGANNFGKVMGVVMSKVKGRADGAKVQELIKNMLS